MKIFVWQPPGSWSRILTIAEDEETAREDAEKQIRHECQNEESVKEWLEILAGTPHIISDLPCTFLDCWD